MVALGGSTWEVIACRGQPTLAVAAQRLMFAPHTAGVWIPAIVSTDLENILPGLLTKKSRRAWAQVYFDDRWVIDAGMHQRMNLAVIGAAAGFPVPAALRLIATAEATWHHLDGWAASRNVDPLGLPLDRFCSLVYHYLTRNAEEKDRFKLESELIRPLPGTPTTTVPEGWDESSSALAALAAHQATKKTR